MPLWENTFVQTLAANEVLVFGSNESGFHGAGAAGFALRGDARNTWRSDPTFLQMIKDSRAGVTGEPLRGKYAVFGVARGYQEGREGASYAVCTIKAPGQKRSVTRCEIYRQLVKLREYTLDRPHLTFIITPLGEQYSGYTKEEMSIVWDTLAQKYGLPDNWRFVRPEHNVT